MISYVTLKDIFWTDIDDLYVGNANLILNTIRPTIKCKIIILLSGYFRYYTSDENLLK